MPMFQLLKPKYESIYTRFGEENRLFWIKSVAIQAPTLSDAFQIAKKGGHRAPVFDGIHKDDWAPTDRETKPNGALMKVSGAAKQ